ncbi:hypothetical protein ACA910_017929 [Epithemia clementina (nom. ined.)]
MTTGLSDFQNGPQQPHHKNSRVKQKLREYLREHGVDEPIYVPAMAERYLIDHANELGYNTTGNDMAEGCKIWNDPNQAPEICTQLQAYLHDLDEYNQALEAFTGPQWMLGNSGNSSSNSNATASDKVKDVRRLLTGDDENDYNICEQLELMPSAAGHTTRAAGGDLQSRFFSRSGGQLSRKLKSGWVEPLLPPMRHPNFCTIKKWNYLNLDYLVHDYAHICRRLKPTSRVVLFDLGASTKFAGVSSASLRILQNFGKFGIPFDHIHAFEMPTPEK